ncbi:uncharacterized protein LOC111628724 [Centruroides sculpturatus]|uniref:uncharacterized protein LOC111628724 n=1 Tax=Centruroides sculpturatus TaxID=218467 RepID=UPI000C6DAFBD|nr:uncharacterized protein LOC111628724 [Centruroides sculpturatus]
MQYSPGVLTDEWHEFIQAQPLDYDIKKPENFNLLTSSYNNFWFGKKTDPLPKSATHEMMDQSFEWYKQNKYQKQTAMDKISLPISNKKSVEKFPILQSHHHYDEKKPGFGSTQMSHYKFPCFEELRKSVQAENLDIPWKKYRLFHSYFVDTDCACHKNIHIWQDEHYMYPHGRQKSKTTPKFEF